MCLIITLLNVSPPGTRDDQPASDYDYRVFVNNRQIARGRVEGHVRDAGWESLVRRFADAVNLEPAAADLPQKDTP